MLCKKHGKCIFGEKILKERGQYTDSVLIKTVTERVVSGGRIENP
jgi:hypothetical protein